jgi:hypothetical protein
MRYVRKQIVTKVIADEVISDPNVIKEILGTFLRSRTDASISYRSSPMDVPTVHERVRITGVAETTFDISVINPAHSMTVRKIPFAYLDYVCTTVSPSEVFTKKDVVERGDILDLA